MSPQLSLQTILAEWLFVETIDDLNRRIKEPDIQNRYQLLGIAPLLRKLLLDKPPLINTIRAVRPDISTKFHISQWSDPGDDSLPFYLRLAGPEPVAHSDEPYLPKLKQFIGAKVGQARDLPLTVRDVVRYYAHVEGGVHFGKPTSDAEGILSEFAPILLGHSTGQIQILAHIGSIVVNALTPLYESILSLPTIDTRMHLKNEQGIYDGHWTKEYFLKKLS